MLQRNKISLSRGSSPRIKMYCSWKTLEASTTATCKIFALVDIRSFGVYKVCSGISGFYCNSCGMESGGGVLLKGRWRLHGKEFANDKQERKEQTTVRKFTTPLTPQSWSANFMALVQELFNSFVLTFFLSASVSVSLSLSHTHTHTCTYMCTKTTVYVRLSSSSKLIPSTFRVFLESLRFQHHQISPTPPSPLRHSLISQFQLVSKEFKSQSLSNLKC
jgi:hypothetical protein